MSASVETLVFWAAITFVTPVAIVLVPLLRRQIGERTIHVMLGLSAGLLLGIVLMDILPESFETVAPGDRVSVPVGIFAGFFVLFVVEYGLLHGRGEGHMHFEHGTAAKPFGALAVGALVFHGTLDGFVIPLAFALPGSAGLVITLAIALHQIPDSFAAGSVALGAGFDRRRSALAVLVSAADTPVGIGFGLVFVNVGLGFLPLALAFAAGTFLFVSAVDLIPELQHRTRSPVVGLSIFLGFVIVALLTLYARAP